jgi:hypothetical protein
MTTERSAMPPETDPMLLAMVNLSAFHREHEKFYATEPREQAVRLQRHVRTLLALADRWSTAEAARVTPFSPFEGATDLNEPSALQLDGVLFMEGEGEPPEIAHLIRDLRTAAGDLLGAGDWLSAAMEAQWGVVAALVEIDGLADLLGDRHRIIANDWQAASMSEIGGRLLLRAADILDRVDFTPAALRADLAAGRLASKHLHSAAELVSHAVDLLSDSAGLLQDNEPRWRRFRHRLEAIITAAPDEGPSALPPR